MFVYCHDCEWQQDDFWSEDYYPMSNYDIFERVLLPAIRDKEKREIRMPSEEANMIGLPYDEDSRDPATGMILVDFRSMVGYELMKQAKKIMGQFWITFEDYQADINKRCPICNSSDLGID